MSAPHLRRRYRTSGSRRGLIYLFLAVGLSALYVGQRVYTGRKQSELDLFEKQIELRHSQLDSLVACRDSLLSMAVVAPRARELGLAQASLEQLARLPLSKPVLEPESDASGALPFAWADAGARLWRWLDAASIETQEANAAQ